MSVSVVIPTRRRPQALRRCLAAVAAQEGTELEIVVVDDGSPDRESVEGAIAQIGSARMVRTPGTGPAAARNLGARAADGDVVLFLDDDCEPEAGWAERLARAAAEAGVAAGRTVAPPQAPAGVVASQAIVEHLTLASLDPLSGRLGFAPSCNLGVSRDALGRLPFDESFPLAAGEDREWSDRASAQGLGALHVPDAVVVHRQRLGPAGFARQQYRYGRGAARYRGAVPGRGPAPPSLYAGLVRRGFREGVPVGILVIVAQLLTAAGVVAEWRSLARPD